MLEEQEQYLKRNAFEFDDMAAAPQGSGAWIKLIASPKRMGRCTRAGVRGHGTPPGKVNAFYNTPE